MGVFASGIPYAHAAAGVLEIPTIPILMFHRVDDHPRYPEDISTQQLNAVLDNAWKSGYHSVNMSDIILDRVDNIVPKGSRAFA